MERAYMLKEIDDLRQLCRDKWTYGSFFPDFASGQIGRTWYGSERDIGTEELVRTYMLAGITAEQIRAEHAETVERTRIK